MTYNFLRTIPGFQVLYIPMSLKRKIPAQIPPFRHLKRNDDIAGDEEGKYDLDLVPTSRKGEFDADLPCDLHHTNW